ncbi:MAG: iron-sulfur cluster assembly scaffold protein [Nanoarchaeota archaeon]|nr:iron-sulfur cluster assembly scaffold protein [Nanoarchaeota archaeon]
MYSEKILKHFKNPKFAGEIKNPDAIGQVGNPRCGDVMKIFLRVKDNVIKDIRFKTYGCIAAIASSDMMCELAKGKTIDKALKIKPDDIVKGLGHMPPIKYHCSILGTQALKKAIENYRRSEK